MKKYRIYSALLLVGFLLIGYFLYASEFSSSSVFSRFPFKFGLDLNGGTELVYKADISRTDPSAVADSMEAVRDAIERRVNVFGVSEPIIQVEKSSVVSGEEEHRLIVELPGVIDIDKAVALIGQTPFLEFKLLQENSPSVIGATTTERLLESFVATGITGRLLKKARLEFDPTSREPLVALVFNDEGSDLFAQITRDNVGSILAIFLDDEPISMPVIREEIGSGEAVISGSLSPEEAKILVRNLNYGALPVPIELVGTQTIGASLGQDALHAGIRAGVWGSILVVIFLIFWYRLPGVIASLALVLYVAISLALFKLIPVTLTAAGLAGFILSIGMAVDANILIFERTKEELKKGKSVADAIREGFHRAWLSIRDSNISSMITALVLFWLGTSAVKGFALTFGVGVLVSMFTAITASRTLLFAVAPKTSSTIARFLFSNGIHIK